MLKPHVIVTTAPRPDGTTYLAESVRSTSMHGCDSPIHVYGMCDTAPDNTTHIASTNHGLVPDWVAAVTDAPDDRWVITLQDDILWCTDGFAAFVHAATTHTDRSTLMFSAYTPNFQVEKYPECQMPGLLTFSANEFFGALALAFPPGVVQKLAKQLPKSSSRLLDVHLGRAVRTLGGRVCSYVPTLVEHVGDVSTLNTPAARNRRGYLFREDAVRRYGIPSGRET